MIQIPPANKIVIIGLSGCGKSTLTNYLQASLKYDILHSDSYLHLGDYGSSQALMGLMRDVARFNKVIVEGSLCYRLLKFGLENKWFAPDIIINVVATKAHRELRRPGKDYSNTDRIYRVLWQQYMEMYNPNPPKIIEFNSSDAENKIYEPIPRH